MTTLHPTMPYHQDDWLTVYQGDCRDVLPSLAAASVNCVVTSPPYWGLRDYGADGQLGLEATPEQYVANLVAVFREVRRVLRDDGTVWLNLGDSYSLNQRAGAPKTGSYAPERPGWTETLHERTIAPGLKPKDLVGIPWRVAFALQADGWWLRSDIIWAKPNPMPESVTDRPTKAHEYLFLLSKRERYYYDQEAVREGAVSAGEVRGGGQKASTNGIHANRSDGQNLDRLGQLPTAAGRNLRSVWTIAIHPYPGAHFAVFPPELPERCIKAGTSERGVCPECGAPWERVISVAKTDEMAATRAKHLQSPKSTLSHSRTGHGAWAEFGSKRESVGWQTACECLTIESGDDYGTPVEVTPEPIPGIVLDPFAGSGTVGLVANRLSRRAILIDLNPAYISQQMKRNAQVPVGI